MKTFLENFLLLSAFCVLLVGCAPQIRNKANLERLLAAKQADTTPPTILQFDAPKVAVAGGTQLSIPILAVDDRSQLSSYHLLFSEDGIQFSVVGEALPEATTVTWKVPQIDIPQAYLKLRATDFFDNYTEETSGVFAIDSTPPPAPSLALTSATLTNQKGTFTPASCQDTAYILVLSSLDTPSSSHPDWQKCSTAASSISYTFTQDQTFSLQGWAKDLAGNISKTSSSPVQITYDGTPPTLFQVQVQTGLTVDVTLNEALASGGTVASNYTLSGTGKGTLASHPNSVSSLSSTKYRLTWSTGEMKNAGDVTIAMSGAYDAAGNQIQSSATHLAGGIGVAPSAPNSLTLITPASSPGNNSTPVIQVGGVTSGDTVQVFSDSSCSTSRASGPASATTIDLTLSTLTSASYTFYAQATDPAGNASSCSSANVAYVLDNIAPVLSISAPSSGSFIHNAGKAAVTVSGSCSENGSTVSVAATDINVASVTATPPCNTGASPNWTTTLNFTTLADGAVVLTASQTDLASNTGYASNVSVVKDVQLPTVSITTPTTGSYVNNAGKASVTVSGSCSENGRTISLSATDATPTALTATPTCNTGATPNWTTTLNFTSLTDGAVVLAASLSDAAGNSSNATNVNLIRDVTAPTFSLSALTGGQFVPGGATYNITWTASDANFGATPIQIEVSSNSGSNWTTATASTANTGSYGWNVPGSTNSATYRIRATASDLAGNTTVSASASDFTIDSNNPTVSAVSIVQSSPTDNNNIQMNLTASDPYTKITHFCFHYNSTTQPTPADSCWTPVNNPSPGITPDLNITFSNFYYLLGFTPGVYTIYGWVRDQAGNISSLSGGGTGTSGTDLATITYSPGSPPALINVSSASTDTPSTPPVANDLSAPTGSDVYIKWNASGSTTPLTANPISLYYTTDDINFTLIATGVSNSTHAGCTITASETGCYKWTAGSPTNSYFRIRVVAENTSQTTTFAPASSMNILPPIKIIAGNTDPGLNGSSTSAMFFNDLNTDRASDTGSLLVTPNGTIYFRDIRRGILTISPTDGVQRLLIPTTGASSGDGGPISSATLRLPNKIALDYQNNILVFDYNRIRKIVTSTNPMTISTIIGGGASNADGVAALSVQIVAIPGYSASDSYGHQLPFFATPNGDIYFMSGGYLNSPSGGGGRIRIYKAATGLVQSIYLSGTGDSYNASQNLSTCVNQEVGMMFDPTTSAITHIQSTIYHQLTTPACLGTSTPGPMSIVQYDPTTGVSITPHVTYDHAINYNLARISGRDGNLYGTRRALIAKYDPATRTWATIVGTGTLGTCSDGTLATVCNIDSNDAFISSQGQIYFMDRGLIRTLDSANKVVTLGGQSFFFGDGGLATSARFNTIYQIGQDNSGAITLLDNVEYRFRRFTAGGNITTIAGTGATGWITYGQPATTQPVPIQYTYDQFTMDPSTGDVFYYNFFSSYYTIMKLQMSTQTWESFAGGGGTVFSAADGLVGSSVRFPSGGFTVHPLGFDGNNVLAAKYNLSGTTAVDSFMKLYQVYPTSNGRQTHLAGVSGNVGSFCADGTNTSSCELPIASTYYSGGNLYDSANSRWMLMVSGSNRIRTLTPGGTVTTLLLLPNNASSFAYRNSPSPMIFYCSTSDGKLHKHDLTTDTTLAWPISSMSCAGKSMVYDSTNNVITFIFMQNGMYGIAQYINP